MQRSIRRFFFFTPRIMFCLLIPIGIYSTISAVGINQQVNETLTNINVMIDTGNATVTTAATIYPEVIATMTTLNNITFDPTDINATLTTLNSIKIDTTATLTTHEAILAEVVTTEAETNLIYTDIQATLTTLNSADLDAHATATTNQAMYSQIRTLTTSLNRIYTEAHATHTTADAIKIETTLTNTNNLATLALLTAINSTETSIKDDTSTMVSLYSTIQTEAVATNTTSADINIRTSTLAIPFYGGTISSPGAYRLARNITGPVNITSSDVCLMLNGYTITAVGIGTAAIHIFGVGLSNIYIAGGTLKGPNISSSTVLVIGASNTQNLIMEHLMLTNAYVGITIAQSTNVMIRDINFRNVVQPISGSLERGTRIKRCLLQFDDASANAAQLIGISLTGIGGFDTGGFFIQNCTIKGYRVGIALTDSQASTIDNCTIGDFDLPLASTEREVDGIIISDCAASVISNCTINSIGNSSGTASAIGINCTSADVFISNCILSNIYSAFGSSNRTYGIYRTGISPDQSNTINCLIDDIDGYRTYGVYVGSTESEVNVNKTVVSNLNSSSGGAAFYKDAAATNCDFTQNVAINITGGATAFSGITNVISGFSGSRTVYNYSLPS